MNRNTLLQSIQEAINERKYQEALTLFRKLGKPDYSNFDELLLAGYVGECTLANFLEKKGHEIVSFSPDGSFREYDMLSCLNGKEWKWEVKLDSVPTRNAWITYEYDGLPDGILQPELTADFWVQVRHTSNKLLISRVEKLKEYTQKEIEAQSRYLKEKKWQKRGRVIVEKGLLIPENVWEKAANTRRGVFTIE